ncbi:MULTISPECIES: winged helix-turn-helix domain-containing protein [unclassified Streptomyces]|uniref:winged helix-turn-helix domain-containing protein n=1 Tax=unclassified Streptomyces TaxID=2593676 RepID=UPI0003661D84|nr:MULTISPECIES: winged helix-turn-helix domain-containing protein [unclassified Streptomyces]MYT34420.1 transcriptional regulator [Streptomyces sp. SID8354]
MTNLRTVPAGSATATVPPLPHPRHRLRAVAPDEALHPPATAGRYAQPAAPGGDVARHSPQQVAELLASGATWLPAPQHSLPALPGQPPMVGYLVLVPAEQAPTPQPPAGAAGGAWTGDEIVRIDAEQRTVYVDGRLLDLTYLEFELLTHLVAHPHRVHTRDQLVTTVWGYGHVGDGRTVDVHVARLRRKLGTKHRGSIVTVRRVGYKYVPSA